MKLKQQVIDKLKNHKRARARLQLTLDKSEYTINKYIQENEVNGDLTKAASLEVIRQELEMEDSEILEAEPEEKAA